MKHLKFATLLAISPMTAAYAQPVFSRDGSIAAPGTAPKYSIDGTTGGATFGSIFGDASGTTVLIGGVAIQLGSLGAMADTALQPDGSGYLKAGAFPALSGAVTSSGGSLNTTLAATGVAAGTYPKVTVGQDGRVTSGAALASSDLPAATSSVQGAMSLETAAAQAPVQSAAGGLGLVDGVLLPTYGTGADTFAAGNDSRIVGALQGANDLSDLASVSDARAHLGLGTAALSSTGSASGDVPVLSAGGLLADAFMPADVAGAVSGTAAFPATGGTVSRTPAARAADVINIAEFGAVGDMTTLASSSYTIAASGTTLTSSAGVFTSAMVGKTIVLPGAGASGAGLVAVISGYTSATQITLATAASSALSATTAYAEVGTDNTAAIARAIAAAKLRVSAVSNTFNYVGTLVVPDGAYMVQTVNLTDLKASGFMIAGHGELWGVNAGQPVVDMLGSRFVQWAGVNIRGDQYARPNIGLQVGRINSTANDSSDVNHFDGFYVSGYYTLTALLNENSETSKFDKVLFGNGNTAAGSYAVIMDGYNHFAATSQYITNNEPTDTVESFNENLFTNCYFSAYTPLWIGQTSRLSILNSYAIASSGAPAVELYNESGGANLELNLDLHIEGGPADDILISGPSTGGAGVTTSTVMEGFHFRDHSSDATNSAIRVDGTSALTSVSAPYADIEVGGFYNGATKLFDSATPWTFVSGMIHVPAASYFTLTNFYGLLSTPTSFTDYSSIASSAIIAGLSGIGISEAGTVGSVTITTGGEYYAETSAYTPTVTFSAAPSGGTTATGHISAFKVYGGGTLSAAGTGYTVDNDVPVEDANGNIVEYLNITQIGSGGAIAAVQTITQTTTFSGIPLSPFSIVQSGGSGGTMTSLNMAVSAVAIDNQGSGYPSAPTVTFSATHAVPAAAGTANLATAATFGGPLVTSSSLSAASLVISGQGRIGLSEVSAQAGSYTLAASDCGTRVEYTGASAATFTVTPSVLGSGCQVDLVQKGAGAVTFTGASGVTAEEFLASGTPTYETQGQYATAHVNVDSSTTFVLSGQVQ